MPSSPKPARSSPFATLAATLVGNLYLVVGSLLGGAAALVAAFVTRRGHGVFAVARAWARGVLATSFLRLESERETELPADGRYVFMANHQSLFDIPVLLASLPGEARLLAKRSLFRIPVFGWALAAGGFVPVDRKDRSSARQSFQAAIERLERGVSILLFPEATRSHDGRLLAFERGGFLLAMKSGLPIVPVGVSGTLAAQPRHSFLIRPGVVRVRYGRPVEVAGRSLRELAELTASVRARIGELAGVELTAVEAPRRGAARKEAE